MELVFVYGTLRKGQRASHYMETAQFLGDARIYGFRLYDLGAYPGVVRWDMGEKPPRTVIGEVYEISSKWLPILDRYEGCRLNDPEQSLYLRVQTDAFLIDKGVTAEGVWVYTYNNPIHNPKNFIWSGDWIKEYERRDE